MEPVYQDQRLLVLFLIALVIVLLHGYQTKQRNSISTAKKGFNYIWFDNSKEKFIYAIPDSGISYSKLYSFFNLTSPVGSENQIFKAINRKSYSISSNTHLEIIEDNYRVAPLFFLPIRINKTDQSTLTTIPGIGPKIAKNIINFRTANGDFKSLSELMKVDGVGEKKAEILKRYLAIVAETN